MNKNEEMYSSWQDNHETESETVKNDQKITIVQLNKLSGFKNHPFKVETNTELFELMQSIEKDGILVPLLALLKQANTDSSKMGEVIGISEAQLRFVTNSEHGMGLLKCGSVVIPFDNTISRQTDLYKLYNTNLHEKIEE